MAMTVEEKRQILYAALLRHSAEAGSLRDRVVDRLVLVALLESSASEPMRVGRIQKLTRVDPGLPGLRPGLIQEALERLMARGQVGHTLTRTRHAYYLTDSGRADTDDATQSAAQLFEPVLARMLQNTSSLCDARVGALVCRTFVSECFARFGQEIAKAVTGEFTEEQLVHAADVQGAFRAAISSAPPLSPEAVESLRARCVRFLRSTEYEDSVLKFRLTQGYYVSQLLGLDPDRFNPIADDAFRGAVFYLDTNVLLGGLLVEKLRRLFDELVRICETLGIDLRVTRATVDEARWVAAGRLTDLEAVLAAVPDQLVERTRDQFLEGFLDARENDPEMTAERFLARFDEIPRLLESLGIELDDRDAVQIVGNRDVTRELEIVDQAAVRSRGWGKSLEVRQHDVCHYLLVQEERSEHRKAWFLTRDRTLVQAARELREGDLPFCFPLTGFVQSVSPFLEAPEARRSLVDLFSAALDGEIAGPSTETLFDLSELRIISELHADVLATPVEDLLPAFDFVKETILEGRLYRREEHTRVALELKKYLASSTAERRSGLEAETMRHRREAAAERQARKAAEDVAAQSRSAESSLQEAFAEELKKGDAAARELSDVRAELEEEGSLRGSYARSVLRLRAGLAAMGAVVATGLWLFDAELASAIVRLLTLGPAFEAPVGIGVRLGGAAALLACVYPIVGALRPAYRLGGLAVVGAVALGGSGLFEQETVETVAAYLDAGTPLGLVLALMLGQRRAGRRAGPSASGDRGNST